MVVCGSDSNSSSICYLETRSIRPTQGVGDHATTRSIIIIFRSRIRIYKEEFVFRKSVMSGGNSSI